MSVRRRPMIAEEAALPGLLPEKRARRAGWRRSYAAMRRASLAGERRGVDDAFAFANRDDLVGRHVGHHVASAAGPLHLDPIGTRIRAEPDMLAQIVLPEIA